MAVDYTLLDLANQLETRGYDGTHLRELQDELEALGRPPGLFRRMTAAAKQAAALHWRNFVGELGESREAMAIVAARVAGREISAAERDKVRAQLVDMVKFFPAGLIAAANSAFPVPGTGLFTPWILQRLGLMPSRWREAHLLSQLSKERDRLRAAGQDRQAEALDKLTKRIEREADEREHVAQDAHLLTHWDANNNGIWDPEEKAAYLTALNRTRELAERFPNRKHWFLDNEGEIYGAMRLTDLLEDPDLAEHLEDESLLVCYDGKTGWVALPHVLGETPTFSAKPPSC